MSDYSEFFLSSNSNVIQFETLEISHPNFTQTYRLVRNATNGITAEGNFYTYYPLKITSIGTRENLDYGVRIDLGDLGEVIPTELDSVSNANGYGIKPTVIYKTYRSDDLTAPLFGPIILEVQTFNFNREGSSFEAKAPSININKTGELYKIDRFPMLRGFL